MVEDKGIDLLFVEYLQEHFKDMIDPDVHNLSLFLGPDNGANNPAYFVKLDRLYDKYKVLKKVLTTVRTTAGLYDRPSRSNVGIARAWTLIMDFDYDRGEWAGVDRKIQDMTLYEFCSWIAPTAVVQTGHGWHLYWVLSQMIGDGKYAYPSSLLRKQLKADIRSILPVQCMNFHNNDPRKPAVMVDRLSLESIKAEVLTFPHNLNIYPVGKIEAALDASGDTKGIKLLKKRQYEKRETPISANMAEARESAIEILEHFDMAHELNNAGFTAYNRPGGKIICCCPFHDDRHPSAYIDLNPASSFFGFLYCTSTHCLRRATLKTVLKELGVL